MSPPPCKVRDNGGAVLNAGVAGASFARLLERMKELLVGGRWVLDSLTMLKHKKRATLQTSHDEVNKMVVNELWLRCELMVRACA